jgi:hypothetical protein
MILVWVVFLPSNLIELNWKKTKKAWQQDFWLWRACGQVICSL